LGFIRANQREAMTSQATDSVEDHVQPLIVPSRLVTDHRNEFRRMVLEQLDQAISRGDATVDLDLGATVEMDASGLGVLVLLQKRARERGLRTRLLHAPRKVYETLRLTRLDVLFEFPTTS